MRTPFLDDSRVTVVLYREPWGKTPWTQVEETAIKDGCLKHGWRRLFFMSLDDSAGFPIWVPDTHIGFSYANFGLEQAIGAIKARVRECGGVIAPVTAWSRAKSVQMEAAHLRKKEQLFSSQEWIQKSVRPAIAGMFAEIGHLATRISSELGVPMRSASSPSPHAADYECALTNGRVGLKVVWHQQYTNVMGSLIISEFHNDINLPGEHKLYLTGAAPCEMARHTFFSDLSVDESLCWISEDKPMERLSTGDMADRAVQMFLDLSQRAMRGEIDTTSEFYRRVQDGWQ